MPRVTWNSKVYEIVPDAFTRRGRKVPIDHYTVEPFIPAQSVNGVARSNNVSGFTRLTFPNFTRGFGRRRIDSDSAFDKGEYRYVFDARGDTRYSHATYLPVLEEDSTGELEIARNSARWQGDVYTLWEDDLSTDLKVRVINSSGNFASGGTVQATGSPISGQDLEVFQTHLVALYCTGNDHHIEVSTDSGATWALPGTTDVPANLLDNTVVAGESTNFGKLKVVGSECVAILWDQNNKSITFASSGSSNFPDTWTDEGVDIPSGTGVAGTAVMLGLDAKDKLYVLTDSGLWEIDTSVSTWTTTRINDVPGTIDANESTEKLVVHQGSLWITTSVRNDRPFDMARMTNGSNERLIEIGKSTDGKVLLGLDAGDGVSTKLNGPCTWMKSAGEFLYAVVGGLSATTTAHIFCHNGLGWHYMVHNGTDDQIFVWMDIDGDNIHYTKGTGGGNTGHYLANGNANPRSGLSIKRALTGFVDTPYADAGFPLDSGKWLRVGINAEDLSEDNTGEYINVDYGEDDGSGGLNAQSNTNLGDILSGTTRLSWGSGAGLASVNMGLRVNLIRDSGTNTDTPKLKDVEIDVVKELAAREGFRFIIDIDKTARDTNETRENVVTNIETARDLGTLAAFVYGPLSTKYVQAQPPLRWAQTLDGEWTTDSHTQRGGFIEVTLEEAV